MDATRIIVCLLLLPCLQACGGRVTTVNGEDMWITSLAFQQYAEEVFRHQNQVGQELLDAQEANESGAPGWGQSLSKAEDRLWDACLLLNDLAIAYQERRELDLWHQRQAAYSVSACEAATIEAERLLDRGARLSDVGSGE